MNRTIIGKVVNAHIALPLSFAQEVRDKVKEIMLCLTTKRKGGRNNREKDTTNPIRNNFSKFLRLCWGILPCVKHVNGRNSLYCCKDAPYETVVREVSAMIHNYVFHGQDVLCFLDYDSSYNVTLITRSGSLILLINTITHNNLKLFCQILNKSINLTIVLKPVVPFMELQSS